MAKVRLNFKRFFTNEAKKNIIGSPTTTYPTYKSLMNTKRGINLDHAPKNAKSTQKKKGKDHWLVSTGETMRTNQYLDLEPIVSPSDPTATIRLFSDSDNTNHLTIRKSDGSEVDLETIAAGANTTLSNLGTTAINADLDPESDNVRCLGSSTKRWDKLFTGDVWTTYLTGNTDGEIKLVGDFVPFDDDTWDLGSSTKKWQKLYANACYLDVITAGLITVTTFSTTGITNLGNGDTDQVNLYGKTDWKTNVTSSSATTGSREGYITIKINGTDKKLYYYA